MAKKEKTKKPSKPKEKKIPMYNAGYKPRPPRKPSGGTRRRRDLRPFHFNPVHMRFIEAYTRLGSRRDACMELNLSYNTTTSWIRHPEFRAKIDEIMEKIGTKAAYNIEAAMEDAKEAQDFALRTDNANAFVKAIELKMKLHGLLIDKKQFQHQASFKIEIEGVRGPMKAIEATSEPINNSFESMEMSLPPAREAIDAEFREDEPVPVPVEQTDSSEMGSLSLDLDIEGKDLPAGEEDDGCTSAQPQKEENRLKDLGF